MAIVKDLGMVTAYAYAVAGGYEGTEAEFTELLGQAGVTLEQLENLSAVAVTLAPGSEATASYSDGVLTFGIPQGAKGDKGDKGDKGNKGDTGDTGNGISSITKTGTSGLVDTYTITFTNGNTTTFTVTNGEDGTVTPEQMAAAIADALDTFSGETHEDMTAGLAEQLLSDVVTTDKKPYLFRRTGADATREFDTLVGGSVVSNQLVDSGTTSVTLASGHKYYTVISGTATIQAGSGSAVSVTGGTDTVTDLTQMFGSTIADYAYTLEQSTAGSGIAWLKSYGFFNGYQAYNAGAMAHVSGVSEHVMTGFNQWDEETESGYINPDTGAEETSSTKIRMKNYMPVIPDTVYYITAPTPFWHVFFDKDKHYVGVGASPVAGAFTTPSNAYYMRCGFETAYGTTYKHDTCINISKPAGTPKNGDYVPYVKHSYTIDNTVTLRGIPKLSDGEIYYDGDTYAHDGTVTRYYGIRAYQAGDESLTDAITDGTNTVYKLQTPTTEQATPYQSPQICDPDGTEQYITDGIPVGHTTEYPANLKGEIERVMVQVPKPPTSNGTYTLKCTVSGGVPSYAWTT